MGWEWGFGDGWLLVRLCGRAGVAFEEGLDFFEFCEGGAGG